MINTGKYSYPKRNAQVVNPAPKYQGKSLFRTGDTKVKCRDCDFYATHETVMRREPDPFDKSEFIAGVPVCEMHARKAMALGEILRIKPFDEYTAYRRSLGKWQSTRATDIQQGKLV